MRKRGLKVANCKLVSILTLAALSACAWAADPDFGPNVLVFKPSMPVATIQEQINKVYAAMGTPEFGTGRSAFLFWPGEYNVDVPVGYYMQVLGLGATPDAVNITGNLHAGPARGNQALVTFWRGAEGLAVKPANGVLQWAVSQADPFRRMHVKGDMVLHLNNGYASGGWMADDWIDGKVSSGPQQQWIARNTEWASWTGSNWNMVFVGVKNAPEGEWPRPAYTKVAEAPVTREKPFLQVDAAGKYSVRVPSLRTNSVGISWHGGSTPGKNVPVDKFYIAQAGKDTADTINAQLSKGKSLILTPGIYKLTGTIHVTKANTVVLGLGMATLEPDSGQAAMDTADVDGIIIAGILFDAGPVEFSRAARSGSGGKQGAPCGQSDFAARRLFPRGRRGGGESRGEFAHRQQRYDPGPYVDLARGSRPEPERGLDRQHQRQRPHRERQ